MSTRGGVFRYPRCCGQKALIAALTPAAACAGEIPVLFTVAAAASSGLAPF
ncbi:hypothetical protein BZL30_6635 [Mycobacterium kansasii]|uniref:Uncharacterized protein n=1 Tax=Mycobacterium kansasii TaxID=1768 RepID=A0A1V3WVB8_MYCKA|nr:hypothetical protein BZL30_6635 [Mycobacterium kansasii]